MIIFCIDIDIPHTSSPIPPSSCGADVVLVQDDALQLLPAADGQGIGQRHRAAVAWPWRNGAEFSGILRGKL